ncbi:MAG: WGR domain-containing protein [Myxococcales bacterium]|nr:WGR domain-containing protein [Myxococcales bacterium]
MARTFKRHGEGVERTWSAMVTGDELVVTTTAGRRTNTRSTRFPSAEVALAALDDAIRQMRDAGWEEVAVERPVADDEVDPDDAEAMLVLADHLTEAGDPRGVAVALQVRAEADPAPWAAQVEAALDALPERYLRSPPELELTWERGYVSRMRSAGLEGTQLGVVADQLASMGAARFLRRLRFEGSVEPVAEVLARGSWPWVRELALVGKDLRRDVRAVVAGMPRLERLEVSVPEARWEGTHLALRDLRVRADRLDMESMSEVSADRLSIWVREPWRCDRRALQVVAGRASHLELGGGAVTEWLEGLSSRPSCERLTLFESARAGEVGWLLEARRGFLADLPIEVRGIEISDADLRRLEGLTLELPVPDVAVARGVDRTSRRQEVLRRFERPAQGRFWEVVREGSVVLVRYGPIGSAGREVRSELGTERAAASEYRKRVNRKIAEGWDEVPG